MRLALWQGEGGGDLATALAEAGRVAALAAQGGADLLVFPEGFLTGYFVPGLARGHLERVEEALAAVGRIAAASGVSIVMGSHTDEDGTLRNAAIAFDATGAETGRYAKRALFGPWERATFAPGRTPLLFDCVGLRVGVAICYDVEFPELIRPYARAGVDLVVAPTALMAPHDRIARQVVPVRAMENQVFLGYCNRTGAEGDLRYVGLSCVCGPRGEVIAAASAGPELLLADLHPADLARERDDNDYLQDLDRLDLAPDGGGPGVSGRAVPPDPSPGG